MSQELVSGDEIRLDPLREAERLHLVGSLAADQMTDVQSDVGEEIADASETPVIDITARLRNRARATEAPLASASSSGGSDAIGMYLNDIGNISLLTAQEEVVLAKLIEAGWQVRVNLDGHDPTREQKRILQEAAAAKDRFIRSNLRLVVSIARRYPLPQGMDLGDLIQEGNLGLEHAVDKFDWRRGFKFSTYSTFWIRQSIGRALDNQGRTIRIPAHRSTDLRSAERHADENDEQLSDTDYELHRLSTPVSLDKTVGDSSDKTLGDMIPSTMSDYDPQAALDKSLAKDELERRLSVLNNRRRDMVELHFGLPDGDRRTLRQIGELYGITAEAARRTINLAIQDLQVDAGVLERQAPRKRGRPKK